ncbi:hypothetical protein DVH24_019063 [Malus domestica]|uniref:Uncharacterized protein n=1 Tax=Malus domestica TaxID=3750 RepID=A0A498I2E2_MALDO|nr:hypothetical protein DVH24_019063 [Malus domestica]
MRDFSFIWSPGPPSLFLFPVTLLSSWTITLSNSPGPHLSRTTLILLQNPKNWRFHGTETKLKSPSFSVPPSSLSLLPRNPATSPSRQSRLLRRVRRFPDLGVTKIISVSNVEVAGEVVTLCVQNVVAAGI